MIADARVGFKYEKQRSHPGFRLGPRTAHPDNVSLLTKAEASLACIEGKRLRHSPEMARRRKGENRI